MANGTPNGGINGTLANGLLAHYSFNDGSLEDLSGNGYNLTKVGTVNTVADKDGQVGQAKEILEINNYLQCKSKSLVSGTKNAVSIWAYIPNLTQSGTFFSIGDGETTWYPQLLLQQNTNTLSVYASGDYSSTVTITTGWHHFLYNDNKLYIDGILKIQYNSFTMGTFLYLFVGYPSGIQCKIDEVRLYNRLLTGDKTALGETATGEIAEIFEMGVNYEVDITPPTFNTVNTSDISNTSMKLNINCNENATAYYKIYTRGSTTPTPEQLKANNDGSINLTTNTLTITNITGLSHTTSYDLYVIAEDSVGNLQTNITKLMFDTLDPTPPTFNTINISNVEAKSVNLNINCTEIATAYYKLYDKDVAAPTSEQLRNTYSGLMALTEGTLVTKTITGLTPLTNYDLYVVAEDKAGNLQAIPSKISFSTIANDKNIKLDLGMFSDVLSPAYYNGFFKSLKENGFTSSDQNMIFLNPNILPKIYEYGIEKNGESITYNLQVPLLPQEEKIIWIENYISPTSDTFKFSGYISDLDKYYGKYSSIQYAKEFKNINDISDSPYPFLLITDKIYNDDNGNIIYKDFNNSNIEFSFLPSEKEEYKSKIILKNTCSEQTDRKEIDIIDIVATNLEVSIADYNNIKIGNVIKIKEIKNTSSPFYNLYKSNYDVKYKIISKTIDVDKFYITLDKVYPYYKQNGKYITPELYSENVIELNYLSIRGNPIISKTGEYEIKDTGSIDRYGDKVYKISSSIFPLSYYEKLGKTIINERKSVNKISNTNYEYKKEYTKFVAEFTIEHYLLNIGDLIYITEDYYYHIDNEPFQVIGIDRQNTGTERSAKIIALSCKLLKDYTYNNIFKEVEASNIKSISSLDPTDYLTDKNILATRYTTQFGESYSSIGKTANIIDKIDKSVKFNISNFTNIDTSNLVFAINDIYYQTVLIEQDNIYLTFLLINDKEDNINKVKVGDIAYIYNNELSTNKALTVLNYQSSRSSNKLFFSYDLKDVYDSVIVRVYESNDYESATMLSDTDEPTLIVQTQTRENKMLIGNTGNCNLKYDIEPDKYYTIHLTIVSLQEDLYPQEKITVYTPTNSYTIDYKGGA